MSRSILWFRQDLRLHDNESLWEAIRNSDELIPVFVFQHKPERMAPARLRFLQESLMDLRLKFQRSGSDLIFRMGKPEEILFQLAIETHSHFIYCNRERTREEVDEQDYLEQKLWTIGCELRYSRGKMLYYTSDLPFPITHCPDAFVTFKKEVEHLVPVREPLPIPETLPPLPPGLDAGHWTSFSRLIESLPPSDLVFRGGESEGIRALRELDLSSYSESSLDDSHILSPWISLGNLSPKIVYHAVQNRGLAGESIRQGLLYRDYLRLMGKKYGDLIFYRSGITGARTHFTSDPMKLDNWKKGSTGVDIIDAAMHHLYHTGWMPDVLRKLTANYFLKVLGLDWRWGAAYFESRLIDYDPCSNWVSWLNLAGLGPERKEDRVVNFESVGRKLDPEGRYVSDWLFRKV